MTYILPTSPKHKKHKTKGGAVFRASIALQSAPRPIRKSLRKTFKRRMADLERHQTRYDRLSAVVDGLSDDDFVAACGRNISALNAASKRIEEIDTDICKKVDDAKKALQNSVDAEATEKNGGISDAQFDEDIEALCKIINQVKADEARKSANAAASSNDSVDFEKWAKGKKPPAKLN